MSLAGRQREALRLADWIAKHHFTSEGDFRAPERKAHEPAHDAWPVYSNAWLVQGLHRIGRWDLSLLGAEFLLSYQLPVGGFYALDNETRHLEPVCTSWGGLAALTTGHLDASRRAGDLLVRMVRSQPDPQRFYFRMDAEGELIVQRHLNDLGLQEDLLGTPVELLDQHCDLPHGVRQVLTTFKDIMNQQTLQYNKEN